ncbi:MAG: beta-L-arabinofuranosidase domain-containing protein [Anaerolineae bacterium]
MPQEFTRLALERPTSARYTFHGLMEQRLAANLEHWLLIAPQANPAMLEMLRDRDREPRRDLVPWAGEFAGKYLTSAVLNARLLPDERLRIQIDRFVDDLIAAQDADDYLGPFPRAERLTGRTLNGRDALWDVWGHYHALLGLLLWYHDSGYEPALNACRRIGDCLCARFLDSGERILAAGAEEMNMAASHGLGLLYLETGEPRYLRLLREIEADWAVPPAGDYVGAALRGLPYYQMPKPRWESLHDVQAILTLYQITGDPTYRRAFAHIWQSIRAGDRHNTGGFSSGEQATGNPYDPRPIETCCTVAWMALTVDMLRLNGDPTVADELELSTLNATLAAQHPSGRWWTYNTPMDGVRRASGHDIVFQAREGSPELNCCSVNGPRSLGMLSEWALMQAEDGLALNYYGPSALSATLPEGVPVQIVQTTNYPRDGRIHLRVRAGEPVAFSLLLRIPGWSARTRAWLNGEELAEVTAGQYLRLARTWEDDEVALHLDMTIRPWYGEREAEGKVSLYRGPLLLAYDRRLNTLDPADLPRVDLAGSFGEPLPWAGGWPEPWLRVQAPTQDGRPLILCDLATAGATGTPYVTWLPM